jgi:hypothetical protein
MLGVACQKRRPVIGALAAKARLSAQLLAEMRNAEVKLTLLVIWFSATLLWPHTESVKFLSIKLLHVTQPAQTLPLA